jgi:thioredoxin reductase
VPVILIFAWYLRSHSHKESSSLDVLVTATESGMIEPPSLHPEIDHTKCIGCTNCVSVCPEQSSHPVLGMIRKKARLIGPTNCIGHGACKAVCPENAITLVFGTDFQTDVPGIFIAGELGGMGLIRNAVEQGKQALQSIIALVKEPHQNELDVVIVGAGPAGIAATLGALESNLRYATVEQEELGGTVAHFPRRKLVMTQPAILPIVGLMSFKEVQKETLIEYWQQVERDSGISISYGEHVEAVEAAPGGGYTVKTNRKSYNTRAVLLAIGRRGSPRKLGVALEAATSIAAEPGTKVTLSYRSAAFSRAKPKNRELVEGMEATGQIRVLFNSNVQAIGDGSVVIEVEGTNESVANDAVVVSAGGILPSAFLRTIGINVETKWGTE